LDPNAKPESWEHSWVLCPNIVTNHTKNVNHRKELDHYTIDQEEPDNFLHYQEIGQHLDDTIDSANESDSSEDDTILPTVGKITVFLAH
jgi:hypothetical protein